MDKNVSYTLAIDLPINQETTKLYSMNKEVRLAAIQEAINRLKHIINKEGFISLERIMKLFGFRANYETPHILFTDFVESQYGSGLLTLFLANEFELDSIFSKANKQQPHLEVVDVDDDISDQEENQEDISDSDDSQ
ncbi:MAG: hypothetical protein LIR46_02965 [Bacteroidota bacterium]|nr:hypothetical protein [Bacteroidota bacterium]